MDRYAVMGNPVKHSKSPTIHAAFAEATGQTLGYDAIEVPVDGFTEAVREFFSGGGKGLNVTVPFKEEAAFLAESLSPDAGFSGAVNTLFLDENGALSGHNTDGIGLVRDMRVNHGGTVNGKRLLILGAGGAARGIMPSLLREEPGLVTIANRTPSRARELARRFDDHGAVTGCGFEDLAGKRFDWVINATSTSLQGSLPPLPEGLLAPGAWCCDLMYADEETPFCAWARRAGAEKILDGLGMLVEQAAESFFLWRGVRPETAPVIACLR